MDDADQTLARKARAGDRAAFDVLVRRFARLVYSRLVLNGASAHLAEDLTQETFLQAWRQLGRLSDCAAFTAWLISIAKTVQINHARRISSQKRREPPGRETEAEHPADDSTSPVQLAEREESRQRVLGLLRKLPVEYQQPLTLRYLGDCDHQSIARQLGITEGSLRGLLHRGLALLRRQMEADISEKP